MSGFAWVTLATNDSYSLGALVLAHSLRQVGTTHQLAVLVTPGVSAVMREKLAAVFNVVKEVNILDSRDEANLRLLQRPELGITFTKLHCWRLTQFEKCVFLDADTFVLQNADELFEREEFSAAPDVGWPDCFNSGVFVYRPSEETYGKLVEFALQKGSFDGGDQGLLNLYFSDWAHKDISKHLPFIYNMCSTACYSYLPAFKQFGGNVKIVHFIGNAKPWLQYFDTETRQVQVTPGLQHLAGIVQQWWNIFCSLVHPTLVPEMTRSSAAHFTSFHSETRPVPFQRNLPLLSNTNQPLFTHDISHDDNKFDYKNIWDPWDDYEKSGGDTYSSHDSDKHVEHSHTFQTYEQNPSSELVVRNEESVEITHSSNISTSNSNTEIPFESHLHNNQNKTNFENIGQPRNVWIDEGIKSHESEYFAHSQPAQESFNLESQTTVVHNPPECNQLAWPHECEPVSCVTNENALHDKSNEVHDGDAGLAGAFARLTLGVPRTAEQSMLEDHLRRQGWEVGNIDYMGRDSFENIWSKICATLATAPTSEPPKAAEPAPAAPAPTQIPEPAPAAPTEVPEPVKPAEQEQKVEKPVEATPSASQPSEPTKEPHPAAAEPQKEAPKAEQPAEAVPDVQPIATEIPKQAPAETEKPPQAAAAEKPAGAVAVPATPLEHSKVEVSPSKPEEAPKPEVPKAEEAKVEAPKPEPPKAEEAKVEAPKAEGPKPEVPKAEEAKVEAPKADETKVEAPKAEEAKVEAEKAKVEAPKPEPPKAEEAKVEAPKPEPPKAEETKVEAPKAEAPKAEETKVVEAPKPEAPKVEAPKPEPPKAEEAKVEALKPEPPKAEEAKVEAPKAEPPKPEVPKAEETKVVEAPKLEAQKAEEAKVVEAPKAEAPKPEAPKAEPPKPEAPKAEAPKPETPKAEAPKPELPKAEAPKAEASKAEASKPEIPKAEAPKPETPKAEAPKPETPKSEAPKPEQPKAEAPKAEAPKPETPKAGAPKPELPKAEAPKPEAPKPETPKAEAPKSTKTKTPSTPKAEESVPAPESPKPEAAAPPSKSSKSPKAPAKESSGSAASPPAAAQPKAAPKKAESVPAPSTEEASGAQGPTPPPRKTTGGTGTKKTGKSKK